MKCCNLGYVTKKTLMEKGLTEYFLHFLTKEKQKLCGPHSSVESFFTSLPAALGSVLGVPECRSRFINSALLRERTV